jgi:hypothetical protein
VPDSSDKLFVNNSVKLTATISNLSASNVGTYIFKVTFYDAGAGAVGVQTSDASFTITIPANAGLLTAVINPALTNATATLTEFEEITETTGFIPVTGSGGSGSYTYSISSGSLPTGLKFGDIVPGKITGAPRERVLAARDLIVTVADLGGQTATKTFKLIVSPRPVVTTSLISTPQTIIQGVTFSNLVPVSATGGTSSTGGLGGITFSINPVIPGVSVSTITETVDGVTVYKARLSGTAENASLQKDYIITATDSNPNGTQYEIDFGDGSIALYDSTNLPTSISHEYLTSSCSATSNKFFVKFKAINFT